MSRKRVTKADLKWYRESYGEDNPRYRELLARYERSEALTKSRRESLLAAVPQWYERPASVYRIHEAAWGRHAGRGYGTGTCRAMLDRLVKEGVLEATPSVGAADWSKSYDYRFVNDGQTPQPDPEPAREPESRGIYNLRERDVIDHLRYGLTTDDLGEARWHLERLAEAMGVDLDFDYTPGIEPGKGEQ